jgi:signal transduction histidine kinase
VRVRLVAKNLIENALLHAAGRPPVEVELGAKPGMVILRIRDHWPRHSEGAPGAGHRAVLLADPARSRSTGGLGLGLYLAKRIAEAPGFLVIESELGQGTLCTVTIPDFVATEAA